MTQSVDQYISNGHGNYSPEPTQAQQGYPQRQANEYPQINYYPPPQQQQRISRNNEALFNLISMILLVIFALGGTAAISFNMGAYMVKIQHGITNTR